MRMIAMMSLIALAGCQTAAGPGGSTGHDFVAVAPVALSAPQRAAVQAGVKKALKDPESARFGRMVAGRDKAGVLAVCGYVNAKNSFGGYTGEKPFMGMFAGPKFEFAGMGGTDIANQAVLIVCRRRGLELQTTARQG